MSSKQSLRRRTRAAIGACVLAVLLAPVVFDRDSFPLATYPMYSRQRSDQSTIVTAHGVTSDGVIRTLTPTLIGDSDDPLVVVGRLRAALRNDRADVRCTEIARRVAGRVNLGDVATIEIVSERHDTVARTLDEPSLIERSIRESCEVAR